jgi:hypothetical protein
VGIDVRAEPGQFFAQPEVGRDQLIAERREAAVRLGRCGRGGVEQRVLDPADTSSVA